MDFGTGKYACSIFSDVMRPYLFFMRVVDVSLILKREKKNERGQRTD